MSQYTLFSQVPVLLASTLCHNDLGRPSLHLKQCHLYQGLFLVTMTSLNYGFLYAIPKPDISGNRSKAFLQGAESHRKVGAVGEAPMKKTLLLL